MFLNSSFATCVCFHLLYTTYLHWSSTTNSLLSQVSFLRSLLAFLSTEIDCSCAWRRMFFKGLPAFPCLLELPPMSSLPTSPSSTLISSINLWDHLDPTMLPFQQMPGKSPMKTRVCDSETLSAAYRRLCPLLHPDQVVYNKVPIQCHSFWSHF